VPGEPREAFAARMRALRTRLQQTDVEDAKPGSAVAVVAHWGVIRALTGRGDVANCEAIRLPFAELLDEPLVDE